MLRRIVAVTIGFGVVGGFVMVQPAEARPTQVEVSGKDSHKSMQCKPKGAVCKWSDDCCSGSCAGPSPPVCQ